MPTEPKAAALIVLILLLSLLGFVVIALLMRAWRRQVDRNHNEPTPYDEEQVDAWTEAGRRAKPDEGSDLSFGTDDAEDD